MTDPLPRDLVDALADRFRLDREIGRGGSAVVYAAMDLRHGRPVAVKVLIPELAAALGVDRFQREIRVAAGLTHPHILPVFDSGAAAGYLYYVMPLISGGSLRDRLTRETQLTVEDAVAITREVAEALHAAHEAGIVHRDIKPENILFESGLALVADFGTARLLSVEIDGAVSSGGLAIGTPAYMSPEQSTAQPNIDVRSDVYSLGIVLYEMLAGATPFASATPRTTLARHVHEAPPPLHVARPEAPAWLIAIVERALAKTPADRYPDAHALAEALRVPTTEMQAVAPRAGSRRDRLMGTLGAVGGLAVAALLGFAVWRATAAPDREPHIESADPRQVAVLYFEDQSANGALRDVADGLTTDLISELAGVESLSVRSSLAVRGLRGVPFDSVARAIRVGTLVSGTVRGSRDSIAVSMSLTDPQTGRALGSGHWEYPRAQFFALQRNLTSEVGRLVRQHIGVQMRTISRRASTTDVEAWMEYQRGEGLRQEGMRRHDAGDTLAMQMLFGRADSAFVRASRHDGAWALPLASRSALILQGMVSERSGSAESIKRVRLASALADSAVARAPASFDALERRGRARLALAILTVAPDTTLLAASIADLRAAAAPENPELPRVLAYLSSVLRMNGESEEAHRVADRAYQADVLLSEGRDLLARLCETSVDLKRPADVARWCEEGRRRFPEFWVYAYHQLYFAQMADVPRLDPVRIWALVNEMRSKAPPTYRTMYAAQWEAMAAAALARAGHLDSARRVLARATAAASADPDFAAYSCVALVALGDHQGAISVLERSPTMMSPAYRGYLRRGPVFEPLHAEPRFIELLKATGATASAAP